MVEEQHAGSFRCQIPEKVSANHMRQFMTKHSAHLGRAGTRQFRRRKDDRFGPIQSGRTTQFCGRKKFDLRDAHCSLRCRPRRLECLMKLGCPSGTHQQTRYPKTARQSHGCHDHRAEIKVKNENRNRSRRLRKCPVDLAWILSLQIQETKMNWTSSARRGLIASCWRLTLSCR